jgi:hypothetical protein
MIGTLSTRTAQTRPSDCWIDGAGRIYPVTFGRHWDFAKQHINSADPVTDLEYMGWVHISGSNVFIRCDLTSAQYDVLSNWLKDASGNFAQALESALWGGK